MKSMQRFTLLSATCLFFSISVFNLSCAQSTTPEWSDLFDGETLEGWTQLGGEAIYTIEEGTIVGTSVLNTPNSFLTTDKLYQDFILEFEVMLEDGLNSGVQFRSVSDPEYMDGRVHGYQFELDSAPRDWTAGLFDEARRGWLYPVDLHPEVKGTYRNNQWNRARIECLGDVTRTFLNGQPVSYLIDEKSFRRPGFIGLQVHSISAESGSEGKKVRWRNLRIAPATPETVSQEEPDFFIRNLAPNQLHDSEVAQGWELLFDGKAVHGMGGTSESGELPQAWTISDGNLIVNAAATEKKNSQDLLTNETFAAFEIQLDFQLTETANSGIKYYVSEYTNKETGKKERLGLEYQILDDEKHPDALNGADGNRTCAGLYDLIAPTKKIYGRTISAKPGEWSHARVIALPNGKVEHWLNGYKVVEFNRNSPEFQALVSKSKYANSENFGQAPAGALLLQDHGDTVRFRSVKVRSL